MNPAPVLHGIGCCVAQVYFRICGCETSGHYFGPLLNLGLITKVSFLNVVVAFVILVENITKHYNNCK